MKDLTILTGDAWVMLREIEPNSVHCAITSPPYYALRDYGTATWVGGDSECDHRRTSQKSILGSTLQGGKKTVGQQQEASYTEVCRKCGAKRIDSQIGLEKTPEEYINNLVRVFRRLRRALRPDGTFWLNIGDSYATSGPTGGRGIQDTNKGSSGDAARSGPDIGFKHKDRIGIPHRLVFALQADGWYFRDEIVWHSPNKMPESCTDRCTKAHEFIFLLTKSPRYFFDYIAIREHATTEPHHRGGVTRKGQTAGPMDRGGKSQYDATEQNRVYGDSVFRNKRSVWTIPSNGTKESHFAAYPKKLILPCILAGTSTKGCCPECGAPYERILEKKREATRPGLDSKVHSAKNALRLPTGAHSMKTTLASVVGNKDPERHVTSAKTIGWRPGCCCIKRYTTRDNDYDEVLPDPVPCVVLDPFGGTGTTAAAALSKNRRAITIELNPEYVEIIKRKCKKAILKKGFGL